MEGFVSRGWLHGGLLLVYSLITKFVLSIPFLFWLYLTIHAMHGRAFIGNVGDAADFMTYINYFLNHIERGVYPLWNPFDNWGRPDDILARMMGEFNPFLYLIIVFKALGLSFADAYGIYLLVYAAIGFLGFYVLIYQVLKDHFWAYTGTVFFLFSNFSSNLYTNFLPVMILIPTIWFFSFLIAFLRRPAIWNFLGCLLTVMTVVTTYIPVYFIIPAGIFIVFGALMYVKEWGALSARIIKFFKTNPWTLLVALFSLSVAFFVPLHWLLVSNKGVIFGWRYAQDAMDLKIGDVVSSSPIYHYMWLGFFPMVRLFLDSFYVPSVLYFITICGGILKINKKLVLSLLMALLIFSFSITDATHIFPFFYKLSSLFHTYRNYHFMIWMALLALIIFALGILKSFLDSTNQVTQKMSFLYISLVHIGFGVLVAFSVDNTYSMLALAFSYIVFALIIWRPSALGTLVGKVLVLVLLVFQPAYNFYILYKNFKPRNDTIHYPNQMESKPVFRFTRPSLNESNVLKNEDHFGVIVDQPGHSYERYLGMKDAYKLLIDIPQDSELIDYVQYKLYWYDWQPHRNWDPVINQHIPHEIITENNKTLSVVFFDHNRIDFRTNIDKDRWLVYNDAYHKAWQASIDGKAAVIGKVNGAFKSVHVPSGEHHIRFQFGPSWLNSAYLFIIFYFIFILVSLIAAYIYEKRV